jgi:hypothetical protein
MLAKLTGFQTNLKDAQITAARAEAAGEEPKVVEQKEEREGAMGTSRFVAEGLYYGDDSDDDGVDWKSHSLSFVKNTRTDASQYMVGRCSLPVSKPELKACLVSARETKM